MESNWEEIRENIESFIDVRKYTYETLDILYNLDLNDEEAVINFLLTYS